MADLETIDQSMAALSGQDWPHLMPSEEEETEASEALPCLPSNAAQKAIVCTVFPAHQLSSVNKDDGQAEQLVQ